MSWLERGNCFVVDWRKGKKNIMSRCSNEPYFGANYHFLTYSFIPKVVCGLPVKKFKKGALALLFVAMEAISVVLDLFGKSKVAVLLVAFLLSALGFAITLCTACIKGSAKPKAEMQLRVVEFVFSLIQLVGTFLHLVLTVLSVKNNYNLSILFPLAFAVTALIFVFKNDEEGYLPVANRLPKSCVRGSIKGPDRSSIPDAEENEESHCVDIESSGSSHGGTQFDEFSLDKDKPVVSSLRRRSKVPSHMASASHEGKTTFVNLEMKTVSSLVKFPLYDERKTFRRLEMNHVSSVDLFNLRKLHQLRFPQLDSRSLSKIPSSEGKVNMSDNLISVVKFTQLSIKTCGRTKYWVHYPLFSKLVVLSFKNCETFISLPSFGHLNSLKFLSVEMRGPKSIDVQIFGKHGSIPIQSLQIFGKHGSIPIQSLQSLWFEIWQEWQHGDNKDENIELLPHLRVLTLVNSPKLVENLSKHLPSLEGLEIQEFVEQPQQAFSSLASFRGLDHVEGCKSLTNISEDHLPLSLRSLEKFEKLQYPVDGRADICSSSSARSTAKHIHS